MEKFKEIIYVLGSVLIVVLTFVIVGYCVYHGVTTECKPVNTTDDPVLMQCNTGSSFYLERKYL